MSRKILNRDESYDFFINCKTIRLSKEPKIELDLDTKFGVQVVNSGLYVLLLFAELSEDILEMNDPRSIKHKVSLMLTKEDTISDTKYLVFSAFGILDDKSYSVNFLLEKEVTIHCLLKVLSANPEKSHVQKLFKIKSLDLSDFHY